VGVFWPLWLQGLFTMRDFEAMNFDSRVTFEPGTGRAILWADTVAGIGFQLTIDPQYAVDLWGLRRPIEARKFTAAIF
jgi:hypothetical protein